MAEEKAGKFLLKWNEGKGEFQPIKNDEEMKEGVFIELEDQKEQWRYFYIAGASLIARRTALRAANGISKTGFLHAGNNIRYGVEHKLVEEKSPYEDMPDMIKKAQRTWYIKEKKK